mgnify:CR=1 FL=1
MILNRYFTKKPIRAEATSLEALSLNSIEVVEDYVAVSVFVSEDILDSQNKISQKLRKRNLQFYNSIKNKITIDRFDFYRTTTKRHRKTFNSLGVSIGKYATIGQSEEYISSFNEPINSNQYKLRYRNSKVRSKIEKSKSNKNEKILEFNKAGVVDGVNIYVLKDYEPLKLRGSSFAYKVKLSYRSNIEKMLREKIKQLEEQLSNIKSLHSVSNSEPKYNKKTKSFTLDYFIDLNNSYDYNVTKASARNFRYSRITSNLKQQAPWIKIPTLFQELEPFLTSRQTRNANRFFNDLNPLTGNLETMLRAINALERFISTIKRVYDIESTNNDLKSKEIKRLRPKNNNVVETKLSKSITIESPDVFFKFLKINKRGFITKKEYFNRINKEIQKFFKASPSIKINELQNLSNKQKQSLVDQTNSFCFLTPETMTLKNLSLNLLRTSEDIFNPTFFNNFLDFSNKNDKFSSVSLQSLSSLSLNIQSCETVENYVGENSPFAISEEEVKSTDIKNETLKNKDNTDVINSAFMSFGKSLSIDSFLPNSKNFRGALDAELLRDLPISVKSLMLSDQEDVVRFPFTKGSFDILLNPCVNQAVITNFLTLKRVQCITRFPKYQGLPVLNSPVYECVTEDLINDREFLFCRMVNLQNKQYGIFETKIKSKTNIFIIKG